MRFLQTVLAALSLSFVAATVSASPASPVNGIDYLTLKEAQPTDAGRKIEVIEFFSYGCPHCSAFEPALETWIKKQGDNIVMKRVPASLGHPTWASLQRLYYALEAMGNVNDMQQKIFNAYHVERQNLSNEVVIADYMAKQGIDRAKFVEIYNSFTVQSKVQRADQLYVQYKINTGVPTIVINGRYVTSPSTVEAAMGRQPEPVLQAAILQVMDALVAKASAERKAQGAK